MQRSWGRWARGATWVLGLVWVLAVAGLVISFLPGPQPRLVGLAPWLGDGGYPQRVGFVRGSPPMPDRPGPIAVIVSDNNFGNGAWEALSASGESWTIADGTPVLLSADGGAVVLETFAMRSQDRAYVVRDLVSGGTRGLPMNELREVAVAAGIPRIQVHVNPPVAWSPDGGSLLIPLGRNSAGGRVAALVDLEAGQVDLLPLSGSLVGFLPDGRALALRVSGPEDSPSVAVSTAHPSSTAGVTTGLRPITPWATDSLTARTTPSGELLVVEQVRGAAEQVRWFDPDSGEELRSATLPLSGLCAIGWAGEAPVFSTKAGDGHQVRVQQLDDGQLSDQMAVHHRMQSSCVNVADDALDGGPTPMALGALDATWTWYWRVAALAVLLVLGASWALIRRYVRRPE